MRALPGAFRRHLGTRRRAVAFACLLVALPGLFSPAPPEKTLDGLTALLGRATGGHVSEADVVWEPRAGALRELVRGRAVLFLAAATAGAPRDLHRAWVRLTPSGQPLGVARSVRLSDTPLVDESGLVVHGERAAFASVGFGRVQAVTLLAGLGAPPPSGTSLPERWLAYRRSGATAPLARTDFVLDVKATSARLALDARALDVTLPDLATTLSYDFVRRAVREGAFAAHVLERAPRAEPAPVVWTDVARAYFGAEATQLLGRAWFGFWHSTAPALGTGQSRPQPRPLARPWLPRPEGIDASAGAAEPYLEQTTLGTDGSALTLVAFDLRQLELGVVAGTEWPHALASVPGDGRLPRDGAEPKRLVAVFNAGAETPSDRYAMRAGGRLLAPPDADAPSVMLDAARGASLGAWPFGTEVPARVAAFTQRASLLIQDAQVLPFSALGGQHSVRARSALCATNTPDRLTYAHAAAADRDGFARALVAAGCRSALPLAAAPERLGFALVRVEGQNRLRSELVAPSMTFDASPLLTGSSRDFFTLSVRDVTPALPPGAHFAPDGGTQPAPAWLPGILRGEVALGALRIELFSLDPTRLEFRLRPGPREPGAKGASWVGQLANDGAPRGLAAFELGHATSANRYGLALGTAIPLALRPAYATLVLGENAAPRILLPGEPTTLGDRAEAVQLPLLADDRDITARARERGDSRKRAALCITDGDRVVIGLLRHDSSDPLAVALRMAGCHRVVELDRGSHHPAFAHRTGTDSPPRDDYAATSLWALARSATAPTAEPR